MYSATTHEIHVRVTPAFLKDQSQPIEDHYVWMYEIEIENNSQMPVQLTRRRWTIINSRGEQERVEGEGVVGQKPTLAPGESYKYQSGCPLDTPSGMMMGSFVMDREDGHSIEVSVPAFSLDSPYEAQTLN